MNRHPWESESRRAWQPAGHRGVGPRGYRRSDDRIREDVNDRLTDDPYIDASDIEVMVSQGEVTLSGTVDHRATKRRVEDLVETVPGVTHVQNNLHPGRPAEGQTGQGLGSVTGPGAPAQAAMVAALDASSMVLGKTPLPAETAADDDRTERVASET